MNSCRRLVVNADDFGLSSSVNEAVIQAHREGILTSASLMVNEPGCAEAVALARQTPSLGVGLHLTFLFGHSALPREQIPGLVNTNQEFGTNPAASGCRFYFQRGLRDQLRREIRAQFHRFRETGLTLDHVNGHLHLHLHPTVFAILMEESAAAGVRSLRLTADPFWLNLRLSRGHLIYRLSHAVIFGWLAARARPVLDRRNLRHTRRVFGLLQNARVDEEFILRLLSHLPPGDSELYSHPSLHEFRHEFEALISPRVRGSIDRLGIKLARYQDL